MTKKKLAEIEKGLWFKQSSLIAYNMQLSRGAPAASSSHSNLKQKLLSIRIEPWSACETAN